MVASFEAVLYIQFSPRPLHSGNVGRIDCPNTSDLKSQTVPSVVDLQPALESGKPFSLTRCPLSARYLVVRESPPSHQHSETRSDSVVPLTLDFSIARKPNKSQ